MLSSFRVKLSFALGARSWTSHEPGTLKNAIGQPARQRQAFKGALDARLCSLGKRTIVTQEVFEKKVNQFFPTVSYCCSRVAVFDTS